MSKNIFFESKGPFKLNILFPKISTSKIKIKDIKTLDKAENEDLTFFDSLNYKKLAEKTKASCCITKESLKKYLPHTCEAIIVKSVLFELARITLKFYPLADLDYPDKSIKKPQKSKFLGVKFGNNVLVGKNVKIGKSTIIGSNTIIEHNVSIGKNCVIGSQVMIKNSIIGNNVVIQDGAKIGLKGFGFIPLKEKNFRIPHIGKVILKDNVEIGACCTIDRGALGNTTINNGVKLDNHIQIAHNVVIGENTVMAAYCGIAGSSVIGKNCVFGGDVCVVGHVEVCDSVMITARTLVTKSISKPGSYSSGTTPLMDTKSWRKNAVRFTQLDKIAKKLNKITNMD